MKNYTTHNLAEAATESQFGITRQSTPLQSFKCSYNLRVIKS